MAIPTSRTTRRTLALSPKEAPLSKLLVGAAQELGKDTPESDSLVLASLVAGPSSS